jgi:hypothetical protein
MYCSQMKVLLAMDVRRHQEQAAHQHVRNHRHRKDRQRHPVAAHTLHTHTHTHTHTRLGQAFALVVEREGAYGSSVQRWSGGLGGYHPVGDGGADDREDDVEGDVRRGLGQVVGPSPRTSRCRTRAGMSAAPSGLGAAKSKERTQSAEERPTEEEEGKGRAKSEERRAEMKVSAAVRIGGGINVLGVGSVQR